MNKVFETNPELAKFSTEDLLKELLYRDNAGDNKFHLVNESTTSYIFKFWKFT